MTAFFDTLGIGSFATTTAVFKLRNMVPVKLIPGTLNVGHALSTIAQAFIYTQHRPVDPTTLVLMIRGGDGRLVARRRRRRALAAGGKIQIGMGIALLGAAVADADLAAQRRARRRDRARADGHAPGARRWPAISCSAR